MRSFVHVAVTLCALAFCAGPTLQDTVKVSVYYESLCPDSVAFIDNQLVPTFKKLSKAIDLDLVPYGKANQTLNKGHWQFTCQHGPEECKGNKLHACLVDSLYPKRSNKLVKVIGCLMGNDDHFKALHQCARKVKLNPAKFIRCAKSVKGENLLAALGDRTHDITPKITYIPTIAFNDVYKEEESKAAETDLESVVCKYVPNMCGTSPC